MLRYRPVRAYFRTGVSNELIFVSHDAYREYLTFNKIHFNPRNRCDHPGAWLSLVKIQLFPLPNCQRTTWQNPRGIHDNLTEQQSFSADCHESG